MSNPTHRYLTDVAIVACKEAQRPTLISATPEDDLTRAKRALWVAEEKFTQILRRNAQARFNSPRLDDAVDQAYKGLAAIKRFHDGR